MMEYCRSENYNFHLLFNDPLFTLEPTSETYKNDRKTPIIESILDFNSREMEKLQTNVSLGRTSLNLNQEQKYMIDRKSTRLNSSHP